MIKSKYILDIIDLIIDTAKDEILIRKQIEFLTDETYDYTGPGLFVKFSKDNEIQKYKIDYKTTMLDGVSIKSSMLEQGAYAILWFYNGIIDHLELFSNNGDYPNLELTDYSLTQDWKDSPARTIVLNKTSH